MREATRTGHTGAISLRTALLVTSLLGLALAANPVSNRADFSAVLKPSPSPCGLAPIPPVAPDFAGALALIASNLPPGWIPLSMSESWRVTNGALSVDSLMVMDRKRQDPFLNLGEARLALWGVGKTVLREELFLSGMNLTPWAKSGLQDQWKGRQGYDAWGPLTELIFGETIGLHVAMRQVPLTGELLYENVRLVYASNAFMDVSARFVGLHDPELPRAGLRLATNLPRFGEFLKGKVPRGVPQPREVCVRGEALWKAIDVRPYLSRFDYAPVELVRSHPDLPKSFRVAAHGSASLKVLALSLELDDFSIAIEPFGKLECTAQARFFLTGSKRGLGLTRFRLALSDTGGGAWGWKVLTSLLKSDEKGAKAQARDLVTRNKVFQKIPKAWQGPLLSLFFVEKPKIAFRLADHTVMPLKKKGAGDVTKFIVAE